MHIADNTSLDVNTNGGGTIPPCTGLTPDAFPEVPKFILTGILPCGVSTKNAMSGTNVKSVYIIILHAINNRNHPSRRKIQD